MPTTTHYRTCNLCEALCGLEIEVEDQKVVSIRGDQDDPFSRGHICPKAVALKDIHEDPDRLKMPVKKTAGGWTEITWEEAFDEAADRLLAIQGRYGKDAVGIYQGNPSIHNLGTTLFARGFIRALHTRNRFSATSVDQLPHHLAADQMFGHPLLLPIPDIDRTDFWLIMGANPLVSNGSLMTAPDVANRLKAIQQRGGKVVVIDPRRTETAAKADRHLFIRPGTDAVLLLALIHEVFAREVVNLQHLSALIAPADLLLLWDIAKPYDLEVAARLTGIEAVEISRLADEFIAAPKAVCYGRMGLSTVAFGGLCQWLINCLNILTGNFDTPGGAMFTTPAFDNVDPKPSDKRRFDRWRSRVRQLPEFGGELPSAALAEEIGTPGEGQIRTLVTSCGNPVLSTPNGPQLEKALADLDFMVSIDLYINETTRHADIILPPATGLETSHYSVFFHLLAVRNTAKYSPPVLKKQPGTKYDWEIFLELQKRLEKDQLPNDEPLRQKMLMQYQLTPEIILDHQLKKGPHDLSLKTLLASPHGVDLGPLQPSLPSRLRTPDQKIKLVPELYQTDLKRLAESLHKPPADLLLIGRRQLRSNNSWMHNSRRLVKGKNRCILLMHPEDAIKRGLKTGMEAIVSSRVGEIRIDVEVSDEMMPGVVSIPHGWGHHREGTRLEVANAHPGASLNDVTDEQFVDALTGNAVLNGLPVEVRLNQQ